MINIGLLILRATTGVIIAGHGAQKLFGWFGGRGLKGQAGLYDSTGLQPGWLWAFLNGLVEFGGGILLTLGILTPIAAGLLLGNMVMAIIKVHWKNGLWNRDGGFEYPLTRLVANLTIGLTGPGIYNLDPRPFASLPELDLFVASTLVGLFVVGVALVVNMRQQEDQRERA
jgi:putative oxidoreductase